MALGVRNIKIKFTGDTSGLDKASATGGKQLSKWQSGFQKFNRVAVPAALAVGAAAIKVGKDSVVLSRRMSDLDAKSKAVFGGQLNAVNKWANANKRAFGLSRRETVGLAANFADLLKPMGFTTKEASKMATSTLDLSGALAKWSGGQYKAAEVSEILSKAMLGEREQLKSLGISISEADVKAQLAKQGQEGLTGAALEQAKAVATQTLIMEKSTDAQNAWANGGRKAAEAENAMSTSIAELQEALATILGPAIAQGTALLSKFAGWVDQNRNVVMVLGGVLVGLAASVFAINAVIKVATALTKVWTAVVWLLNIAMKANPIGRVIMIITGLIAIIITAWKKNETFRKVVTTVWNKVKGAISSVVNWLTGTAWPFIKRVWDSISNGVASVKRTVVNAWNTIKNRISGVASDIKGFLSGMWDGIVSGAKAAINTAIRFVNGAIRGINKVTGAVGIPGIPEIPQLAKGGVVSRPTLALIGENGREAVIPLDRGEAAKGQFGGGGGIVVNGPLIGEMKSHTDRFSLRQVQRELVMHASV